MRCLARLPGNHWTCNAAWAGDAAGGASTGCWSGREGHGDQNLVNEVVLRTQAQAVYSPENIGHFGLNLQRYAHFTSPIRRYADLIVHRALIRALKLGPDGMTDQDTVRLKEKAEHDHRRPSAAPWRPSAKRPTAVAAYLAERVGAEFDARITGVTRFGLFVRLSDTGADGLCPPRPSVKIISATTKKRAR